MQSTQRLRLTTLFGFIFLAYAGMQLYAVSKAYAGLGLPPDAIPLLAAWLVVMTFVPLLLWKLERSGWHRLAVAGAWIGYTWMGVVFLFFWIALALDVLGAAVGAAGAVLHTDLSAYASTLRHSFSLAAMLSVALAGYGFFEAHRVRLEGITLASAKPAPGSGSLRIALISDVHLGALVGARRLRRILERVRGLDADVLVSTGDLVDGQADRLKGLAPLFDAVRPRHGKFAVTGNHEYFVGLDRAIDFHTRAGFTVLRGTAVDITKEVSIAGVDDPTGARLGVAAHTDERAALSSLSRGRFIILLKHQPVVDPRTAGLFDLQLSGHIHRGQIFPFGLLVRLVYPVHAGLTRLATGGWLYVSRGTGTWGPPFRVLAPPEITLIEIKSARS